MKYSGLYFISNPGTQLEASQGLVQSITHSIETNCLHANRQSDWKLNHRLFRDLPPTSGEDQAPQSAYTHTYRHFLHLSYLNQTSTYDFIQSPAKSRPQNGAAQMTAASPGDICTIPVEQTDTHHGSILTFMTLLWSPQRVWDVPRGITYTGRGYSLHIGVLQARRQGPQALNVPLSPGIVVCISTETSTSEDEAFNDPEFDFEDDDDDDEPINFGPAKTMIKELWAKIKNGVDLARNDVREYIQAEQDFNGNKTAEQEAVVRMWCEALRPRT